MKRFELERKDMGSLEEVKPIFGEAKVESSASAEEPRCFVFHVHASDPSHLAFHVTDFRSHTWESLRSHLHLEDMRDAIGIGGSWSEFIGYVTASFQSQDVKLVLDGSEYAKLVARKAKGMPAIAIPLKKLSDSAAGEAIANLSLQLFQSYRSSREEQARSTQLENVVSVEQGKSESIKRQLEHCSKSPKLENTNSSNIAGASPLLIDGLQFPEKQGARNSGPAKVATRAVPTHRRTRNRGVVLQDTDDIEDNKH